MIFKPVTELENTTEKNVFIEQARIFTRLVEVFCEMRDMTMPEGDPDTFINECLLITNEAVDFSQEPAAV